MGGIICAPPGKALTSADISTFIERAQAVPPTR
jgi:hypothetical protein